MSVECVQTMSLPFSPGSICGLMRRGNALINRRKERAQPHFLPPSHPSYIPHQPSKSWCYLLFHRIGFPRLSPLESHGLSFLSGVLSSVAKARSTDGSEPVHQFGMAVQRPETTQGIHHSQQHPAHDPFQTLRASWRYSREARRQLRGADRCGNGLDPPGRKRR